MAEGSERLIKVVVFDVGETLVNETRAWSAQADAAGVTELTLFGVLGALIERGEHHRDVWPLLGVQPPSLTVEIRVDDFYPDAFPCLRTLAERGFTLGLAGNQPAEAESALRACGLPVSFIAASARWGVEKPSPEFFARIISETGQLPDRIAYVGDRMDNDVLPARQAGMYAVLLRRGPWGHVHARRPDAAGASATIDSLAELPELLAYLGPPPT